MIPLGSQGDSMGSRDQPDRDAPQVTRIDELAVMTAARARALDPDSVLDTRFFKLFQVDVRFVDEEGATRELKDQFVYDRGDSVAVLAFDRDEQRVILVEQVRAPVLGHTTEGRLIETVAGMPRQDGREGGQSGQGSQGSPSPESHLACALHELREETGIDLSREPQRLFPFRDDDKEHARTGFFASPGGSSERIFVLLADVTGRDAGQQFGGLGDEGEHTRILRMPMTEFFHEVDCGGFSDAKILVAAQLLRERNRSFDAKAEAIHDAPIEYEIAAPPGAPRRILGLLPGDILRWRDVVEIWGNSEDPNLTMDRMIDPSLSAAIRRGGAVWLDPLPPPSQAAEAQAQGRVERLLHDTVAEALTRSAPKGSVRLGDVFLTTPGALRRSHGVRRIAHVIAVDLAPRERGIYARPEMSATFAYNALAEIDRRNRAWRWPRWLWGAPFRSVALPLFGAGTARADVEEIAPDVVGGVRKFFDDAPDTEITRVYVNCYTRRQLDFCRYLLRTLSRAEGSATAWLTPRETASGADNAGADAGGA